MAAGLSPPNGATGQTKSTQIRMEFCGMTELELNYFQLKNPDDSINSDVIMVSDDNSATITPNTYLADGATYSVVADGRINDNGTVKAINVGTWAFTIAQPVSDYLYEEDFNNTGYSIPHTLNQNQCTASQPTGFGWNFCKNANEGSVHLVSDPEVGGGRGTVFKIDFKEGEIRVDNGNGMQGSLDWSGGEKEEIYYAYDIFFPNDFIFNFACKNITVKSTGVLTDPKGEYARVGIDWWGENSFVRSIRTPFNPGGPDGEIAVYSYHKLRSNAYGDPDATGVAYTKGEWNRIEVHAKMNSPRSSANGEYHIYRNGVEIESRTNLQYLDIANAWNHLFLVFFSGGGSSDWQQPKNQSCYIDNIIVSENPITHG